MKSPHYLFEIFSAKQEGAAMDSVSILCPSISSLLRNILCFLTPSDRCDSINATITRSSYEVNMQVSTCTAGKCYTFGTLETFIGLEKQKKIIFPGD